MGSAWVSKLPLLNGHEMSVELQVSVELHKMRMALTWTFTAANSGEFIQDEANSVIIFMPEISRTHMGGTMRLGLRPTVFAEETKSWSLVSKLYGGADKIWERHRHRYEVNPLFVEKLEASGLSFTGKDEKGERMQVLEVKGKI